MCHLPFVLEDAPPELLYLERLCRCSSFRFFQLCSFFLLRATAVFKGHRAAHVLLCGVCIFPNRTHSVNGAKGGNPKERERETLVSRTPLCLCVLLHYKVNRDTGVGVGWWLRMCPKPRKWIRDPRRYHCCCTARRAGETAPIPLKADTLYIQTKLTVMFKWERRTLVWPPNRTSFSEGKRTVYLFFFSFLPTFFPSPLVSQPFSFSKVLS